MNDDTTEEPLSPKDAVIGILVGAVRADGREFRAEFQAATLHLENIEGLDASTVDFTAAEERLGAMLAELGRDAFLDRCTAALPPGLRRAALLAVVGVVVADHDVSEAEVAYLRAAGARLGVPEKDLLDVLQRTRVA